MSSLQSDIRILISRYGYKEVREGLEREMRETYEYLKGIYGNPGGDSSQESSVGSKSLQGTSGVAESFQKSSEESEKVLEKKKKSSPRKPVKKTKLSGEAENLEKKSDRGDNIQESVESAGGKNVLIMTKSSDHGEIRNVVIIDKLDTSEETEKSGIAENFTGEADSLDGGEKSGESAKRSWPFYAKKTSDVENKVQVETTTDKKYLTKEELKAKKDIHLSKVHMKKIELSGKGVNPYSLLTKESLEKWLLEGWTYWRIAEETGCSADDVSKSCKGYGLKKPEKKSVD